MAKRKKHVETRIAKCVPATEEKKNLRGMKLKTASRITILFAVACLLAFMAGRPPADASQPAAMARPASLVRGQSDPNRSTRNGRDFRRLLLQRERVANASGREHVYAALRVGDYELGLARRNEN